MKPPARWVVAVALLAFAAPLSAGELGQIDFPNSGAPEAQGAFVRGVLLLHSFEYDDAREAFQEAEAIDPDFALAYWGEAMTHNHPLWWQQDRDAARAALARLAPTAGERLALAATERERGYLAAVETLYGEGTKGERDRAYAEAMARLQERFPDDLEAAAFHALAILGSVRERDVRTYMRAAAVAEEVFAANPLHPGAAHYLIHSYDDPVHAPLGLRAARVYAGIAPAATHAQHMISHIYTALGRWDEVVAANRKAVEVSEARLERKGLPLARRSKHSLFWLEYALLQQGRFDQAAASLATMAADAAALPERDQLWHYAQMRAAFVVADPFQPGAPPAIPLPEVSAGGKAADAFATGWRAAAVGDPAAAAAALEALRGFAAEAAADPDSPGEAAETAIMVRELEGVVLLVGGETDQALARLVEAAAAEAERPLEYGPPSVVKPSHELLGEALLAAGRPDEARRAFDQALERAPRRSRSLLGLARAAAAAGDQPAAEEARATLREIWRGDPAALEEQPVSWVAPPAAAPGGAG